MVPKSTKHFIEIAKGKMSILRVLMLIAINACVVYNAAAQRKMEYLTRSLVAVKTDSNTVFLSWRFLGTDTGNVSFNILRNGNVINAQPITGATNYIDSQGSTSDTYVVRRILNGNESYYSADTALVWENNFKEIPVQRPQGGTSPSNETYTYSINDCSVADLDGDGVYEIILKWNPSNAHDNSESGYTGNVLLDAYKLDGTLMWRIDLGKNIRAGAHYTQFIAYDLDCDGKAEVACRTADGTRDGNGMVIGDSVIDYRNTSGRILKGPEWLTIFNGETGAAMNSVTFWPRRHPVYGDTPTTAQINTIWGDNYGNRIDRFLAGVAYLDGVHPSLIMSRGYYTRAVVTAWDWNGTQLSRRWVFDTNFDTLGNANDTYNAYRGQGAHSLSIADVDGDGFDEITYGAAAIDHDGTGLYSTGIGHGDALHVSDMNPDRPGLEVFMPHESESQYGDYAHEMRDAATGQVLWGGPGPNNGDNGRGIAADIDPRYKGYEAWSARGGLYSCTGVQISTSKPSSINFAIWWDGDLLREMLSDTKLSKWNHLTNNNTNVLLEASNLGAASNNSTKATPCLTADLYGDWREEVLFRKNNDSALMLFTTTALTDTRLFTLMHDSQYREAVAWQNVGYNQPPHPSFYLGDSMTMPPLPNISVLSPVDTSTIIIDDTTTTPTGIGNNAKDYGGGKLLLHPNPVSNTITLTLPDAKGSSVLYLFDVKGQLLLQLKGDLAGINQKLNKYLPNLLPGHYFVKISNNDKDYQARFVKQTQ
ncbi:MAG: T9SS type A sorting domain-containing protein [Edaphocola sp.]